MIVDSALGWIGQLAEFLGAWFPRLLVVQSSHRAVKYRNGHTPILLEPGRHVYWPIMSPIETCAVVPQVDDMPTQLLETADGVAVAVGAVAEFEVEDAVAFLAQTQNGFAVVRMIVAACVRDVVITTPYDDVTADAAALNRRLTRQSRRALRPYGVLVRRVRLTDYARVRPIHLTGGGTRAGAADFEWQ